MALQGPVLGGPGGVVALVLAMAIVVIAAVAIVRGRRRRAALQQRLLDLGWTPVAALPSDLAAAILRLYQGPGASSLQITHAYTRSMSEGRAVWFDLVDGSGNDSWNADQGVLSMVAPLPAAPDFWLAPRLVPEVRGQLASTLLGAAERFLDRMVDEAGWVRVGFEEFPTFDRRTLVFGRDEDDVRRFLTPERLTRFVDLDLAVKLRVSGEAFSIVRAPAVTGQAQKVEAGDAMEALLVDARRVYDWLQRG